TNMALLSAPKPQVFDFTDGRFPLVYFRSMTYRKSALENVKDGLRPLRSSPDQDSTRLDLALHQVLSTCLR
ncbi:hypothetical protein, partial [Thiohalocapsa halophila]|uniref:hypothetical protein n=1 Tax=Thiohalocapsa halophila TaxID=69359 RepID=UPI001A936EE9